MMTVKEVSELTGISVRTLHYYDEIGLFSPSAYTEAGYRLYDDKALETLQQILFFREFDMPLKEIKSIIENPALDRTQILTGQRKMLELKKKRLERLISSIDDTLKGAEKMDFAVFEKEEIEEMYQALIAHMGEDQLDVIRKQYGGLEEYQEHFLKNAGSEKAQKNFQKMVEWYGDKESVLKTALNPEDPRIMQAYQNRLNAVQKKLADKKGTDVTSFEVREIVGEYDFVSRQLYQMKDVTALMLELADCYQKDENMRRALDVQYGDGSAQFIAEAIREFYRG